MVCKINSALLIGGSGAIGVSLTKFLKILKILFQLILIKMS